MDTTTTTTTPQQYHNKHTKHTTTNHQANNTHTTYNDEMGGLGGYGLGEGGDVLGMRCVPGDARSRGYFSAYDNILVGLCTVQFELA